MNYQPLSTAARNLQIDEETLLEFARKSWIRITAKRGLDYVEGHQEYKARYIMHLRVQRKLTDEQIALVLSVQEPPYSVDKVDQILAQAKASRAAVTP